MKSDRKRFKRDCLYSSRGSYVAKSHRAYLKEKGMKSDRVRVFVDMPARYFVKCCTKLVEVTEREGLMLGKKCKKIHKR